jgi:hypothetical protein
MFIPRLNTHIYSPVTAGTMYANCFWAKKGTDRLAVGRGCWSWRRTTGKQHHSTELASCRQPCEFMPPMGGRVKATHDGGRLQPEERHILAAAVLRIIKNSCGRWGFISGRDTHTYHDRDLLRISRRALYRLTESAYFAYVATYQICYQTTTTR